MSGLEVWYFQRVLAYELNILIEVDLEFDSY